MHSKNKIPLQHLYNTTGKAKSKDKRSAKTLAEVQTVDRRSGVRSKARKPAPQVFKQPTVSSVTESSVETEREKPTLLTDAYQTVQKVEDKYYQILKKYKELKSKSQKESSEEIRALKQRADQIKALEDKLAQLVQDNESLKSKMLEIDQKFAGKQPPKPVEAETVEKVTAAHEKQVAQLKQKIRELEDRYDQEIEAKKREYQEKLETSAKKYKEKEKQLKSQIEKLRDLKADQPSESRSRSRSDRTPSPLNVKRLLGDAPANPKPRLQQPTQQPPAAQTEESVKRLEKLVLKVLEEYKDLKSENLHVASKLDSIERFLEKLDNHKSRTPNRLSSMEAKRQSHTPERNGLSTDLQLAGSRSGEGLWRADPDPDSELLRQELHRPDRLDPKERLGSLTTVAKPDFFSQPKPLAHLQARPNSSQRVRREDQAVGEPASFTADYQQLIRQMHQIKQEFRDLDEENRNLYQLM